MLMLNKHLEFILNIGNRVNSSTTVKRLVRKFFGKERLEFLSGFCSLSLPLFQLPRLDCYLTLKELSQSQVQLKLIR